MSWGFSAAGNAKAVAKQIRDNGGSYMPEGIKSMVEQIASKVPDDRILYVDTSGHVEFKRAPEKMFDHAKSKELGKQVAVDGTDYDGDPMLGDAIYGSATLTLKIMAKAE